MSSRSTPRRGRRARYVRLTAWATLLVLASAVCPPGMPGEAKRTDELTLTMPPHHTHGGHDGCHDGDCRRETVQRVRVDAPVVDAPAVAHASIEPAPPSRGVLGSTSEPPRNAGPPGATAPLLC